jgi:hypothetical protein
MELTVLVDHLLQPSALPVPLEMETLKISMFHHHALNVEQELTQPLLSAVTAFHVHLVTSVLEEPQQLTLSLKRQIKDTNARKATTAPQALSVSFHAL